MKPVPSHMITDPSIRSNVLADKPFFAVVMCQAASNQVVKGVRVLSKIVPAVTVH
jgi:hypothetical protein